MPNDQRTSYNSGSSTSCLWVIPQSKCRVVIIAPKCHMSSDTIFARIFVHFQPNFTSHSLPHLFSLMPISTMFNSSMLLCLHAHKPNDKNTIRLVRPDTKQLVYWATDIPKQSCCGSSSPGSCAGTSSAATECSHHSKFQTSRTRSTSRSVSIA